jgi:hypothetical protein
MLDPLFGTRLRSRRGHGHAGYGSTVVIKVGCPLLREQFHAHARDLDVLRSWLTQTRLAARQIGAGQPAFGPLGGRVLAGLGDRHLANQERVAFVEENLALAVENLRRVADGRQQLVDWLGVGADGSAVKNEVPLPYDRPQSLSRIMDELLEWVRDREWVEPALAEAAPVAEFATPVDEQFAALRTIGLQFATAHVEPVRQILHDLSAAAEIVADQVERWHVTASDLHVVAVELRECLAREFGRTHRADIRAYLDLMSNNVEALLGYAAIATATAEVTKSAGDLVLLTRDIVRGLIGDLFAHAFLGATGADAVVARPALTARLATVVATTWRIHFYVEALLASVTNLSSSFDN